MLIGERRDSIPLPSLLQRGEEELSWEITLRCPLYYCSVVPPPGPVLLQALQFCRNGSEPHQGLQIGGLHVFSCMLQVRNFLAKSDLLRSSLTGTLLPEVPKEATSAVQVPQQLCNTTPGIILKMCLPYSFNLFQCPLCNRLVLILHNCRPQAFKSKSPSHMSRMRLTGTWLDCLVPPIIPNCITLSTQSEGMYTLSSLHAISSSSSVRSFVHENRREPLLRCAGFIIQGSQTRRWTSLKKYHFMGTCV